MAASVYSRTFQKATEVMGSRARLCRHLRVPADELQKWIDDKAAPPMGVFLRAVDLLLEEAPGSGEGSSGPGEGAPPRDCSAAQGSFSSC